MISQAQNYFDNPRPDFVDFIAKACTNLIPQQSKLLEIGCGAGANHQLYRSLGYETIHGVEFHPEMAEVAKSRFDHVFAGPIEKFDPMEIKYNVVVAGDILEHLVNPWDILRRIRTWTTEDSYLGISVPNVQHWHIIKGLLYGRWDYVDSGILDRTHLRFFTNHSFRKILTSSGWKPIAHGINPLSKSEKFAMAVSFGRFSSYVATQNYYVCTRTKGGYGIQ